MVKTFWYPTTAHRYARTDGRMEIFVSYTNCIFTKPIESVIKQFFIIITVFTKTYNKKHALNEKNER